MLDLCDTKLKEVSVNLVVLYVLFHIFLPFSVVIAT